MNIFKILANGDGRINEPNVSAFLGYLLNPYEDHGLGFEFLERFLQPYFETTEIDFNTRKYDYEIVFEQAFKKDGKKQIVDIVILCFENGSKNIKESKVKSLIEQKPSLKFIFIVENKIKNQKPTNQFNKQFENVVSHLKIPPEKIVSIYVTPNSESFIDEFNSSKIKNKFQWHWKNNENSDLNDLYNLLLDIIKEESSGFIEAINEYTRHTLISFIKFIENDFKSQIIEKKEFAEGKYKKDIFGIDQFDQFRDKYNERLDELSWRTLSEVRDKLINLKNNNLLVRHSKTHYFAIFYKSKRIIALTSYKASKHKFCIEIRKDLLSENISSLFYENYNYTDHPNNPTWGFYTCTQDITAHFIISLVNKIIKYKE